MKALYTAISSVVLFAATATMAADKQPELKFEATEVTPGLYMLMGVGGFTGGNIGLSVGDDGVVMIDDAMPSTLEIMQKAVESVTDRKIDFLINTHVHGDHIGNNEPMAKSGARIVAHKNLREHLVNKGISTPNGNVKASKEVLPVITFSQAMSFHLNGEQAQLIHVPHAHTDGDTVVHFENANVIHTGDTFFNGMFPYIDLNSGGSVDGYIAAQKKVIGLSNNKTKIIPGHGPLASVNDLQAAVDMLEDSKRIIQSAINKGMSEDDVVKQNPLKKYHEKWNWGFITTERMTRQLYKGLKGNQQHSHAGGASHSH